MEVGGRGEKSKPTVEWRRGVRAEVDGRGSVAGVRPRATAITFVLPKNSLENISIEILVVRFWWGLGGIEREMGEGRGERGWYLLSLRCVRTSLRYVFRMLSTLKT